MWLAFENYWGSVVALLLECDLYPVLESVRRENEKLQKKKKKIYSQHLFTPLPLSRCSPSLRFTFNLHLVPEQNMGHPLIPSQGEFLVLLPTINETPFSEKSLK